VSILLFSNGHQSGGEKCSDDVVWDGEAVKHVWI